MEIRSVLGGRVLKAFKTENPPNELQGMHEFHTTLD